MCTNRERLCALAREGGKRGGRSCSLTDRALVWVRERSKIRRVYSRERKEAGRLATMKEERRRKQRKKGIDAR